MAIDLGYDEGGAGDDLLVSAQFGITKQTKKLKRHWKAELGNLEYFHSKELWNFTHGIFSAQELDRREREKLLKHLAKLIHRHLSCGVTARISKKFYESNTTKKFRSQQGSAYTFAIGTLLVGAYVCMKRQGLPPEVNILIEDGHRNSQQAVEILERWKKAPVKPWIPVKILTVGLGSKADHPILQTADMLAYAIWQKLRNGDLAIYDALHSESSLYQPEFINLNLEVLKIATAGMEEWATQRKAFGERKARQIEQSDS